MFWCCIVRSLVWRLPERLYYDWKCIKMDKWCSISFLFYFRNEIKSILYDYHNQGTIGVHGRLSFPFLSCCNSPPLVTSQYVLERSEAALLTKHVLYKLQFQSIKLPNRLIHHLLNRQHHTKTKREEQCAKTVFSIFSPCQRICIPDIQRYDGSGNSAV